MSYGVALRNGIPFTLGTIAALCVNATGQAWSPAALWPTGTEPGMWIDPSNLASQWQDSTGTTSVSTPGTVADSSNPVGLALDLRLGATTLTDPGNHMLQATSTARPLLSARRNLLTYTEDFANAVWGSAVGEAIISGNKIIPTTSNSNHYISQGSAAVGVTHTISVRAKQAGYTWLKLVAYSQYANFDLSSGEVGTNYSGVSRSITAVGDGSYICTFTFVSVSDMNAQGCIIKIGSGDNASWDSALFSGNGVDGIEISNVQLELGTTATPYQAILTDGSTYPSTGFPIYQKHDGTDDGMATAGFAAGTLINGMDCMVPVRRDSAAMTVLMHSHAGGDYFGHVQESSALVCYWGAGNPTVYVNDVQLSGGTSVTAGTLAAALTVGDWYILEFRGLDLGLWDAFGFGLWNPSFPFNGAQGGILLFPSSTSTADRDAARTWLGAKVGLTL